jgi:periplasmic protein TonB
MSASPAQRWPETVRWGLCFALALCFHAAGAAALLARWNDSADLVASAPAIMIELAPVPVAPEIIPNDTPPDPQQVEAQPEPEKPVEKVETPPEPQAELQVTPPPKPIEKPTEQKPKQKQASLPTTPSTAAHKAERAAARAPGSASLNSDALPNWKSQLVARLERYKRYPSEAQSRGERGVAQLAFSIDRHGGVHNAHIVRSSGSSLLDRETLLLLERAQPLPAPPAEIPGAQIAIVVPIRYNFR